jgi:hypothetical protein
LTSRHHGVELVEIRLSSIRHLSRVERKGELRIYICDCIHHKVISLALWDQPKWI